MKAFRWLASSNAPFSSPVVATLGNFDGIHRGHQALINIATTVAETELLVPVVISFYPHPATVLFKLTPRPRLTSWRQRVSLFSELGIEEILLIRFTKALAALSPTKFLQKLFNANVRHLVIGPYARIGKGQAGTPEKINEIFTRLGGKVTIAKSITASDHERFSSSRIRTLLANGDLAGVEEALGRSYSIEGHVIHGSKRGRTIGYPTANLAPGSMQLPPRGVYASYVYHEGSRYQAMTNVGLRPTVDASGLMKIETHIFNFTGSLYSKIISVSFEKKLRDEQKFASLDALKAQLARDATDAQNVLV